MNGRRLVASAAAVLLVAIAYMVVAGRAQGQVSASAVAARYQVVSANDAILLVDTRDGHTWQLKHLPAPRDGRRVWAPIPGGVDTEMLQRVLKDDQ